MEEISNVKISEMIDSKFLQPYRMNYTVKIFQKFNLWFDVFQMGFLKFICVDKGLVNN